MANSKRPSTGFDIRLSSTPSHQPRAQQTSDDTPFCIGILGDFSGRENHSLHEPNTLKKRRINVIDRDNFDQIMASYGVHLSLPLAQGNTKIELQFDNLDDFHPDVLFKRVELFSQLRDLRRRLLNNATFADAAEEIQGWLVPAQAPASDEPTPAPTPPENLLDAILSDSTQTAQSTRAHGDSMAERLIREAVAPYVVAAPDPRQDEMVAALDQAIAAHMRSLLHHPQFQALEAAWRAVFFLVRALETGTHLKLYLLDVSKKELEADLGVDDLQDAGLYKRLCDPQAELIPWSLWVGNMSFGARIEDSLLLAQIGALAQTANAPFIAAALPSLVQAQSLGTQADADDWQQPISQGAANAWSLLRQSPVANYLALALPRFMLRTPYGEKTDPIESFHFEEMPPTPCHECYLWGNAAFAKAYLLAQAFTQSGWQMRAGQLNEIQGLALHYYDDDGQSAVKPCAEILLTDRASQKIAQQGLISLRSVQGSDTVRCESSRSVAQSGAPLAGRWQND